MRNDEELISVEIHGPPQRAHSGICGAPVVVAPVVPRPQQVLPPPVVRHLVEDPAALQHVEGVNFVGVEAVLERGAVLSELHHLASVIFPLVQSDPVGASLAHLEMEREEKQTTK